MIPLDFLPLDMIVIPVGTRDGMSGEMFDSGISEPGSLEGEKAEGFANDEEADFGPIVGDWNGVEMGGDAEGVKDSRGGIKDSEPSSFASASCNGSKALLRDATAGSTAVELARQSEDACT